MSILSKNLGLISMLIGILLNITTFTYLAQPMNLIIIVSIIGLILSGLSLYLKNKKKWMSLLGGLFNLIPLAYLVLLFFALA